MKVFDIGGMGLPTKFDVWLHNADIIFAPFEIEVRTGFTTVQMIKYCMIVASKDVRKISQLSFGGLVRMLFQTADITILVSRLDYNLPQLVSQQYALNLSMHQ